MKTRTASMALIAGLSLAAPTVALATPAPAIVQVEKTTAPAAAKDTQTTSYAEREAQDKQVQNYEGGSTVVVAMSGGAFVVLILLLLLL